MNFWCRRWGVWKHPDERLPRYSSMLQRPVDYGWWAKARLIYTINVTARRGTSEGE